MFMSVLNVYAGNPTAGLVDGTEISAGGTYISPMHFDLNALSNPVQIQKAAIRTAPGYTTVGTTTISVDNDTGDRLKLGWAENGEWSDSISTAAPISNSNVVFYAKAQCSLSEYSRLDRTIRLIVSCQIAQG